MKTINECLEALTKIAAYKGKTLKGLRAKMVNLNSRDSSAYPWALVGAIDSIRNAQFSMSRHVWSEFMLKMEAVAIECASKAIARRRTA